MVPEQPWKEKYHCLDHVAIPLLVPEEPVTNNKQTNNQSKHNNYYNYIRGST